MIHIPLVEKDLNEPREIVGAIRRRRGGALSNLDRLLLNSPALASAWNDFLGTIRGSLELQPFLRELVICAVGVVKKSDYELFYHRLEFLKAGGTEAQYRAIEELAVSTSTLFNAGQREAFEIARAVAEGRPTSDIPTGELAVQELVEVGVVAAVYVMVTKVVAFGELCLEDDVKGEA